MDCLRDDEVAGILRGDMPALQQDRIEVHLGECEACQRRLAEASGMLEFNVGTPAAPSPALENLLTRLAAGREGGGWPATDRGSGMQPDYQFLAPPRRPGDLGSLGAYNILHLLGRGGMGAVFAGLDSTLNRLVAVKVPFTSTLTSLEMRQRALREARAVAAVEHDNIVRIYSVSEEAGLPIIVMELVDGESLAELLEREGRLSFARLTQLAGDVGAALQAAHGRGLVHRDIKPANILFDKAADRFKVTDFGLARSQRDMTLTAPGVLSGTPEYMSPEQVNELAAEARSDLFSLGVVFYQCACAVSPFRAATAIGSLQRVVQHVPPSLREQGADVPVWFSDIVERLMAKEPGDRLASAHALSELIAAETGPAARLQAAHRGSRRLVGGLSVVLAATSLLAGWMVTADWNGASGPPQQATAETAVLPARRPGFYLTGREVPFLSLNAALQAAAHGDDITVEGHGPFATKGFDLGDKSVRIVASAASRPVFVRDGAGGFPLLAGSANLHLDGLELRWEAEEMVGESVQELADSAVLSMQGGSLTLSRCRVVARSLACIGSARGSVTVTDSHLESRSGPCVAWLPEGGSVQLSNCVLEGGSAGVLLNGTTSRSAGQVCQLLQERCHIAAPCAVNLLMARPMHHVKIGLRRSICDVQEVLRVAGGSNRNKDMSADRRRNFISIAIEVDDSGSSYPRSAVFLTRGPLSFDSPRETLAASLEDWHKIWSGGRDSSLVTDFEESAESGESPFSRLRRPVPQAMPPNGADTTAVGP